MPHRLRFWLGLLFGALAALRLLRPALSPAFSPADFADALLLCDRAGTFTPGNPAAEALLGPSGAPALRYPTGQPVPPGQHPISRAARTREAVSGVYRLTNAAGAERVVEIAAWPLPRGRAAATLRDVTREHESEARAQAAEARQARLCALARRVSQAKSGEEIAQAVIESVGTLPGAMPGLEARLYGLSRQAETLTCLASSPPSRSAAPPVRFDARDPALWRLYVERTPAAGSLPLVAGGLALGHLTVLSADPAWRAAHEETLTLIAALAASALAGPAAASETAALTAQAAALREIAGAVSRGSGDSALADLVTAAIKRLTPAAAVCTVSRLDNLLTVTGQAWTDDLLRPQTAPQDPRLHGKAVQKALRTRKIVVQTGIANPSFETGPWRAFAGTAGRHTVTALPLPGGRGVLTVYTPGDAALPDAQIKFLETLAALLPLRLVPSTEPAGRAEPSA